MNFKILNPDSTDVHLNELDTWAGRSKFMFVGTVEQGIFIYFGKGHRIKVRAGQFARMLEHFAGCTVKVGTSRTNPPRDSLGTWLMANVTKTAIASYVAPILIAEGLAFRNEKDSTLLRFMDGIRLEPDLDIIQNEYIEPVVSVYDSETGNHTTFNGIDGKTLACLEYERKLRYKRVTWSR
jgi:hypothetical protein